MSEQFLSSYLRPATPPPKSGPPLWIAVPGGVFAGGGIALFIVGPPVAGAVLIGVAIGLAWCAREWSR